MHDPIIKKSSWTCNIFHTPMHGMVFIIDSVALAKQGDYRFGNIRPSVRLSVDALKARG